MHTHQTGQQYDYQALMLLKCYRNSKTAKTTPGSMRIIGGSFSREGRFEANPEGKGTARTKKDPSAYPVSLKSVIGKSLGT